MNKKEYKGQCDKIILNRNKENNNKAALKFDKSSNFKDVYEILLKSLQRK